MNLVEPSGRDKEFERGENKNGEDVERRLVSKDGIGFHSFKRQDSMAELYLGCRGGDDGTECAREHRHEDGEKESVAEEGEGDHERWPEDLMEFGLPVVEYY